ncbi:MAG TPA: MBL fold metallo-hydrolase [Candidatus Krumholzibacterium sp.]|nr:MBL fold metallo-hydrolase [Candidatus Krumholzibacterium sp.]
MKRQTVLMTAILMLLSVPLSLPAQEADRQYAALKNITGGLYLVENVQGGNIVVRVGEEDLLMVDTGAFPGDSPKIAAAIAELTDKPVRTVVITHWHSDHVAGNVFWAGKGATITGHEALTGRLAGKVHMDFFDRDSEPIQAEGLPKTTFEGEKTLPGEIRLLHIMPGHTDGDCIVHFKKENVIHVGDLYFNGLYPYIGVSSGGSIDGMIGALTEVLGLIGDDTVVVPGHGPLSDKAGLKEYIRMLSTIRGNVAALLEAGRTLEEIQAAKPTAEFDEAWGKTWLSGDEFTRLVVMSMS